MKNWVTQLTIKQLTGSILGLILVFPVFANLTHLQDRIVSLKTTYSELQYASSSTDQRVNQIEQLLSIKNQELRSKNNNLQSRIKELESVISNQIADNNVQSSDRHAALAVSKDESPASSSKFSDYTKVSSDRQDSSPKVLGVSTSSDFITSFRQAIVDGLPSDILTLFKGGNGGSGSSGTTYVTGPTQYSIGQTLPTATNLGTIGGVTHLGTQEISTNQLTVTQSFTVNQSVPAEFAGNLSVGGNLSLTGNQTTDGDLTVNGNTTLGNANTDTLTLNSQILSNIIPSTDNTYNLGSDTNRWKDANLSSLIIRNDNTNTAKATLAFSSNVAKLSTDSASSLQLTTDSNTGLFIDTTGNIGIGTTTPGTSLDVVGTIRGSNGLTISSGTINLPNGQIDNTELANSSLTITAGNGLINGGAVSLGSTTTLNIGAGTCITSNADDVSITADCISDTQLQYNTGQHLTTSSTPTFAGLTLTGSLNLSGVSSDITTSGVEHLALMPGGNVGIGTTNPGYKLEVNGAGYFANNITTAGSIQVAGTTNSAFGTAGNNSILTINSSYTSSTGGARGITFQPTLTPATTVNAILGMYLLPAFNVPVNGTNSIVASLRIEAPTINWGAGSSVSETAAFSIVGAATGGATNYALHVNSGFSAFGGGVSVGYTSDPSANNLTVAGNVGIGTTSPTEKLDVTGNARIVGDPAKLSLYQNAVGAYDIYGGSNETGTGTGGYMTYNVITSRAYSWAINNVSKMVMNNAGNIGIGTTSPGSKLQVTGDIRITAGSGGQIIFADGSTMASSGLGSAAALSSTTDAIVTGDSDANGSGDVILKTGSNDRLHILNNGSVGIGITAPGVKLHVVGQSGTGNTGVVNVTGYDSFGQSLVMQLPSTGYTGNLIALMKAAGGSGQAMGFSTHFTADVVDRFSIMNHSGTENLVVLDSGNVGIGTTVPDGKLDVRDGYFILSDADVAHGITTWTATNDYATFGPLSGTDGGLDMTGYSDTDSSALRIIGVMGSVDPTDTTPAIIFRAAKKNGTGVQALADAETAYQFRNNNTNVLTILGNGYVGIGTTTPERALHVATGNDSIVSLFEGTNASYAALTLNAVTATAVPGIRLAIGRTNYAGILLNPNNYSLNFSNDYQLVNTKMTILTGGNVGIGTTTPVAKLHIKTGINENLYIQTLTPGLAISANNDADNNYVGLTLKATTFTFWPNGTRRIDVDGSGNLGIGTTTPGTSLDVNGVINTNNEVRLTGNGLGLNFVNGTSGVTHGMTTDSSGNYYLTSGGSTIYENLYASGSRYHYFAGNVGIGTTTPGSVLDVYTNSNAGTGTLFALRNADTAGGTAKDLTTAIYGSGTAGNDLGVQKAGSTIIKSTNAGILAFGTGGAQPIVFSTNNAEAMRIISDGNVGVGTTNPVNGKLEVVGQIASWGNDETNGITTIGNSHINVKATGAAGAIRLWTNGAEKVRIDTSGNVGIGTTTPGVIGYNKTLTITANTNGQISGLELQSRQDTSGDLSGLEFLNNTTRVASIIARSVSVPNSVELAFYTDNAGSFGQRMVLDKAGNLGIGTTTPGAKLDVNGSARFRNWVSFEAGDTYDILGSTTNLQLRGWNSTDSAMNTIMTLVKGAIAGATGNVGIGTTTPAAKLSIVDGTYGLVNLFGTTNTANVGWGIIPGSTSDYYKAQITNGYGFVAKWTGASSAANAKLKFTTTNDNTAGGAIGVDLLTIQADGNVGIGTTTPGSKLQVYGGDLTVGSSAGVGKITFGVASDNDYITSNDVGGDGYKFYLDGVSNFQVVRGNGVSIPSLNVGIGTTAPSSLLHISHTQDLGTDAGAILKLETTRTNNGGTTPIIYFKDNYASGYNWALGGDDTGVNFSLRKAAVATYPNVYALTVQGSSGNVGIGTSSPDAALSVVSGNTTTFPAVSLNGNSKRFVRGIGGLADGASTPQYYHFATYTAGAGYYTDVVKGRVTMGRSYSYINQSFDFEFNISVVNGVVNAKYLNVKWGQGSGNFYVTETSTGVFKFILLNNFENQTGMTYDIEYYGEGGTNAVGNRFAVAYDASSVTTTTSKPSGTDVTRFDTAIIKSTGNVGIGTTTPGSLLSFYGVNSRIKMDSPTGAGNGTSGLEFDTAGSGKASFGLYSGLHNSTSTNVELALQDSNHFVITGGNVGIGNVTPDAKLLVVGNGTGAGTYGLIVRDSTNNVNNLYISDSGVGYLRAAAWSYGSDRRMKENINYITEGGLQKILALQPASFDYIQGEKNNLGFIAQDVQQVIPEAVVITDPKTGMLGLKTDFIIPYLVNAFKEMNLKVEDLQSANLTFEKSDGLLENFMASLNSFGVQITDGVAKFKELWADKVKTNLLCVGETCVTEQQLKDLLQKNNVTPSQGSTPTAPVAEPPVSPAPETPVVTPEPTPEVAPVVEPAPDLTPAPEVTPEVAPAPAPVVEPAPEVAP